MADGWGWDGWWHSWSDDGWADDAWKDSDAWKDDKTTGPEPKAAAQAPAVPAESRAWTSGLKQAQHVAQGYVPTGLWERR